jgi:hypothetical protein
MSCKGVRPSTARAAAAPAACPTIIYVSSMRREVKATWDADMGYAMRASAASSAARSPPSSTLPTAAETTVRGQGAESREPPLSSPKA